MFDNVGDKLKIGAKIIFWVNFVATIASTVYILFFNVVSYYQKTSNTITGIIVLIGGLIFSYFFSLVIYGLGELIEITANNEYYLRQIDGGINGKPDITYGKGNKENTNEKNNEKNKKDILDKATESIKSFTDFS